MNSRIITISFMTALLTGCLAWNARAQNVWIHPVIAEQLGAANFAGLQKAIDTFYSQEETWFTRRAAWSGSDYEHMVFPTQYLYGLENYGSQKKFFKPSVISATELKKDKEYLLRVAYIRGGLIGGQYAVGAIAYIGASFLEDQICTLKNPTDMLTKGWQSHQVGRITFHIRPGETIDMKEAQQSDSFNTYIAGLLQTSPVSFDYYSCKNREQTYQMYGYDFKQDMYFSNGIFGWTDAYARRIFAANNSEYYPHEICHLYILQLLEGAANSGIINEGIATYFGGSSGYPVAHHLKVMKNYLSQRSDSSFTELLQKGEVMITENTNLQKALGALMVQLVWESKGLQGLKKLYNTNDKEIVNSFGKIMGIKNPDAYLLKKAKQR